MVFQQIKVLLLSIVHLIRKALCCFSRKRKASFSEPMTNVVVDQNYKSPASHGPERDWNSWDDSPKTVQEHIEQYRQRIAKPPTPQREEAEPDFFKELVPVIKPQTKYYLGDDLSSQTDFSRLEAKTDVPITLNADLEDWDEEDCNGWEGEMDTEETKQLIREKRRELRNKRMKSTKVSPEMLNNFSYGHNYNS